MFPVYDHWSCLEICEMNYLPQQRLKALSWNWCHAGNSWAKSKVFTPWKISANWTSSRNILTDNIIRSKPRSVFVGHAPLKSRPEFLLKEILKIRQMNN